VDRRSGKLIPKTLPARDKRRRGCYWQPQRGFLSLRIGIQAHILLQRHMHAQADNTDTQRYETPPDILLLISGCLNVIKSKMQKLYPQSST